MSLKVFLSLLALLLGASSGIFSGYALAQDCVLPANYHGHVRPDPEGKATKVTVGIMVADVTAIDDVGQALEGDFIVRKKWRDRRLAEFVGCRFHRSAIWFPLTDVLNSNQLKRSRGDFAADQARIGPGGIVEYYQRFFGKVATYHNLRDFPFDKHRMRIRIAALEYPADELEITLDRDFTGLAALLNIPDWSITGIEADVAQTLLPEFRKDFSMLHIDILASRNAQYYVWYIMLPLTLIVLMSFVVFWVNPDRFGPQIGVAATSMLTLIAFREVMTTMLPKLNYFTLMDELVLGSTLLVFGALAEATVTSALVTRGKTDLAIRIDRLCQWLFPAALIGIWIIVLI